MEYNFFNRTPVQQQKSEEISLDKIFTSLYFFPDKIQFCHHNTLSFAQHKALDEAYEQLDELKDSIIEQIIGYTGQRISSLNLSTISNFTEEMPKQLAQEIMSFGKELEEWAEQKSYCNIENLAQEYSGVGARLNYLLTLK